MFESRASQVLGFVTAYPTKDASLEVRPKRIALRYLTTSFLLQLPGLVPLELVFSAWQYVRFLRWLDIWMKHDNFRSVTSTANDGPLDFFKYLMLLLVIAQGSSQPLAAPLVPSPH